MKKNAKKLTNEELKQKAKSYGLNIENLHRAYIIENIKWYEKYKAFSTQTQKKIERLVDMKLLLYQTATVITAKCIKVYQL